MADYKVKGTERVANLLVTLVNAPQKGLTKRALLQSVAGYIPGDERAFERDKQTLLDAGIALRATVDEVFTNEVYYSVDLASSDLNLTSLEAAVVLAAIRMWSNDAHWNVREVETKVPSASPIAVPKWNVSGTEALSGFMQALVEAKSVSFTYRKGSGGTSVRRVDPWKLHAANGAWYLVGFDLDRQEPRTFRISRVSGEPKLEGCITHAAGDVAPFQDEVSPVVSIAPGTEHALRLRGQEVIGGGGPAGWQTYELEEGEALSWLSDLVACGANVVVLDPPELRSAVISHFEAMVENA